MQKIFNDTGTCIPSLHYMVDTGAKVLGIINMIEKGQYFTINKPRQFGKTTTINLIVNELKKSNHYLPISISFEGIGDEIFEKESKFCKNFIQSLIINLPIEQNLQNLQNLILEDNDILTLQSVSWKISELTKGISKKIILLIDEVDKSSNNQLFISFLGMLRHKFLQTQNGNDSTFYSVILAGVHDVKTLKLKINPNTSEKLNSPWNIASDFLIDMSFNSNEIATMLTDYCIDRNVKMDTKIISEKIYFYTSGYPFLVSKMCKIIDEFIIPKHKDTIWKNEMVDESFKYLINKGYTTTLFQDIIKNLEKHTDVYDMMHDVLLGSKKIPFDIDNTVINLAMVYGMIANDDGNVKIFNKIFDSRLSSYMVSKMLTEKGNDIPETEYSYYTETGLDIKGIFRKFQKFMKENYSNRDDKFIEREGRLLFLAFLKPTINGKGFDFKEPVVGNERRMDIVVVYNNEKYVIELKRWDGEVNHQKGIEQLSQYLNIYNLNRGFLLIFDFRKEKEYKEETIVYNQKEIFTIWV